MDPDVETGEITQEDGPSLIAEEERTEVEMVVQLRKERMKMRLLERR